VPTPASLALETAYRDRLVALGTRTAAIVGSGYRMIDPDALAAGFRLWVPGAAAAVQTSQEQAQSLAAAFTVAYVTAETGRAWEPAPVSAEIPGTQSDGRPLAAALAGAAGLVWAKLKSGSRDAIGYGEYMARLTASSAVLDTGWRELGHQSQRQSRAIAGWYWVCSGAENCPACLRQQDGRVRPARERMRRHPGCDCTAVPALAGGTFGRPTGQDLFMAWSPEQQARAFKADGAAKAAAIRSGRATLADYSDVARTARGPIVTEA
jgi:hypothetical protein